MSSVRMQHFVTRLKSKNFEVRKRAARDLNLYVNIKMVYKLLNKYYLCLIIL